MARTRKNSEVETQTGEQEKQALLCQCGCGDTTKNRFRQGHDARHKGNLLTRYDEGDQAACAELIERGWRTQEQLNERTATAKAAAERRAARAEELAAKAAEQAAAVA